jgi:hypothetical protein
MCWPPYIRPRSCARRMLPAVERSMRGLLRIYRAPAICCELEEAVVFEEVA